jgi:hypothetical protein
MKRMRQFAAPLLGLALSVGGIVGCTYDRHEEIPPTATLRTEGDERLSFTAPSNGQVYLFDAERNEMVYQGSMKKNETIVVDPEEDKVFIAGHTALEDRLNVGNRHRIFFEPDNTVTMDAEAVKAAERSDVDVKVETTAQPAPPPPPVKEPGVDVNVDVDD